MIAVEFGGDHPIIVIGLSLDGYHRPLGGEVASLTVRAAFEQFEPGWLEAPPLGLACSVLFDGEPLMDGALYGVKASAVGVELRIEG
ncbi:MAG TPA: hypothetical protein DCQ84_14025 [Candidatus Competibacteraceae bacterium]|nr:hypothetical protein [Candidatus Competibacteraceae bacterium]